MPEQTECPLCGMGNPHLTRCPSQLIEYVESDTPTLTAWWLRTSWDEPYPFNLSRWFWLVSGQSQRTFEAEVLAWGKN